MNSKLQRSRVLEDRTINYQLAEERLNANERFRKLSKEEKRTIIDNILLTPFLDLTDDYAFKKVLGNNAEILRVLLSDILDENIRDVDYVPNEIPILSPDDKHPRFDVNCKLEDGRQFVVEMQNVKEDDLYQRLFYYGASLSTSQVRKGDKYDVMRPTYVIAFLNFLREHLPLREDKVVFRYSMLESETGESYANDPLSLYLCELPRLNKGIQELASPIEKWLYILRNCSNFAEEERDSFGERFATLFDQARTRHLTEEELMEYLDSKISAYRAEMIQRAGYKDGFKDGEKKGIEKGAAQRNAEIARAMLTEGLDVAIVSKCTGLTPEEIKALPSASSAT